jgi:GTP-binding protein
MFIDEAKICLVSGRGGDGIISFHREKYRPKGGPDGGDGGRGGDVILRACPRMRTLLEFKHRIHWKAERGGHGGPNRKRGRDGKDLIVRVPVGTVVKELRTGEVLADLAHPGQEAVLVRGGEGGRGNAHFKSPKRRAPRIRERGAPGQELWVKLELKLLADVGLIGLPNSGKSTLLAKISAKRPKIAPYPFTTLEPNLGVVQIGRFEGFVAVDIPGLIEGAHAGKGLGHRFLKHVERTKLLVHLIDISGVEGRDPIDDYHTINDELRKFSEELSKKPQIVVGNKIDLIDEGTLEGVRARFRAIGVEIHPISAYTGEGVQGLIQRCYRALQRLEAERPREPEQPRRRIYHPRAPEEDFVVERTDEGFHVHGAAVERLSRLSLEEPDAQEYLQEQLERLGVLKELRRQGAQAGDRVIIGTEEFEYRP